MQKLLSTLILAALTHPALAFDLTSPDMNEGEPLATAQVGNGFGCKGGDLAPALNWKDAPVGTRSFAITVYDPDAPTGSGWWHWLAYDIPASVHGLPAGVGVKSALPEGVLQGRNDGGVHGFSGACPPPGDRPHHYIFTVHALKVDKLQVPEEASAALIGFMLHVNALGTAKLTATYAR